jgi:hypothetical protein
MMPPWRSRAGAVPTSGSGDGPELAGTIVTVCPGSSAAEPPFQATGVAVGTGSSRGGATTLGTGTAIVGSAAVAVRVGRGARGVDRRAGSARMTSRLETTCT